MKRKSNHKQKIFMNLNVQKLITEKMMTEVGAAHM